MQKKIMIFLSIVILITSLAAARMNVTFGDIPSGEIVFSSRNRHGNWEVYLMSSDGSGVVSRLTNSPTNDMEPVFSPDGDEIVYSYYPNELRIITLDRTTDPISVLSDENLVSGSYVVDADWSINDEIAYVKDPNVGANIWVVDRNTKVEQQITDQCGAEGNPSWSPEGDKIAYYSTGENCTYSVRSHYQLEIYDFETQETQILEDTEGNTINGYTGGRILWSPSGKKLLYTQEVDLPVYHVKINYFDLESKEIVTIFRGPDLAQGAFHGDWSPDEDLVVMFDKVSPSVSRICWIDTTPYYEGKMPLCITDGSMYDAFPDFLVGNNLPDPVDEHIVAHAQYDPAIQDWYQDQVDGSSWEVGSWVNLEIRDGGTLVHEDAQFASDLGIDSITVNFTLGEFDLQPGHEITMFNNEVTETHIVQPQVITSIDVDADVISGTAPPGSEVIVWYEIPSFHELFLTADGSGNWTADFGGIADIDYGTAGAAVMNEPVDSASHTRYNWGFEHTHIEASLVYDQVGFYSFTPLDSVTLNVYEFEGGPLLFNDTFPLNEVGVYYFDNEGIVDLEPGMFLTALDNASGLVKELFMEDISISEVSFDEDWVNGTGPPESIITVGLHDDYGFEFLLRDIPIDNGGNWIADFAAVGEDISEDLEITAMFFDPEIDETKFEYEPGDPPIIEGNLTHDWINVMGFTPDASATIEFFEFEGGGLLDIVTIPTDVDGNGWIEGFEHGNDLVPGLFLRVSDDGSEMVKELELQELSLDVYDIENEYISGNAPPDAVLWVNVHDEIIEEGYGMEIQADSSGFWEADFVGIVDLRDEDMSAAVMLFDQDGDATLAEQEHFEPPMIEGALVYDWIYLRGFAPETDAAVTINGETFYVNTWEDGTYWMDRHEHGLNLVPGSFITASQGDIYKELTLQDISITNIDYTADTISGTATEGFELDVQVFNEGTGEGFGMNVVSGSGDTWTAYFTEDITEDLWVGVNHYDEDKDATVAEIPQTPFFIANVDREIVVAIDWQIGTEITLTVDSISGEIHSETQTVASAPFDPFTGYVQFSLPFDLVSGHYITIEGGGFAKSHTVKDVAVTTYDLSQETLGGIATPGALAFVAVLGPNGEWLEVQRWDEVDGSGNWSVDFSVPGPGKGEENTHDLVSGDNGVAQEFDDDGDATEIDWVLNAPPEVEAGGPYEGFEGEAIALLGSAVDPDDDPLVIEWTYLPDNGSCSFGDANQPETTFTCDEPGDYVVTLSADDGIYEPVTDFADVTVINQAPIVDAGGPYEVSENNALVLTPTVSDAEGDALTYLWSYAPEDGTCTFDDETLLEASITCTAQGSYTLTLEVADPYNTVLDDADLTVVNRPPEVIVPPVSGDEGAAIAVTATVTDLEGDPLTYLWSYEPMHGVCSFADPAVKDTTFTCQDNGEYEIMLTVSDGVNPAVEAYADASIANVAPELGAIIAPIDPVAVDVEIGASAPFTDPGSLDTHTSLWYWGDGGSTDGVVDNYTSAGTYTYDTAGVYTLTVEVEDDDGGWDEEIYQYVVVYDPDGGFVTGGGWINSPAGAYDPDPSLTGKANFGFVSKYKKGANVPTGQTQFHFKVANLKFHSDSYEWLVVAGKKAIYKGVGTINGEGEYGFMLSCIDGDLQGGDGIDRFRIRIWDKESGGKIYDNQQGEAEDADPVTALGGGSIVIHKAKKK